MTTAVSTATNTPIAPSPLTAIQGPARGSQPEAAVVYQNPIPVGVALIPVQAIDPADGKEKIGILTVRRGIEPMKGKLALPGGYMGYETWADATTREVNEETGLNIPSDRLALREIYSVRDNTRMIFISESRNIIEEESLKGFKPHEEVEELVIVFSPTELAFSSHTDELKNYFERERIRAARSSSFDLPEHVTAPEQRMLSQVLRHLTCDWPNGGTGFVYVDPSVNEKFSSLMKELSSRFGFSIEEIGTTGEYGEGDRVFVMSPNGSYELPGSQGRKSFRG